MPKQKSAWFHQAAAIALSLGLAGCAAPAQHAVNSNEIVVGVAGPMSGALAAFGEQELRGTEMAVQDINAAGRLLGKQLYRAKDDDACAPSGAVRVANDMVAQGAALVVGHFCSGSSIPASSVYAAAHVVQITPSSTNPRVTVDGAAKGVTTLFRVVNSDERQAIYAGRWMAKAYAHRNVVVLADGSAYGNALAETLTKELEAAGTSPILTRNYQQKSKDFSDLIAAIKQSQAHVVYIGGYHNDFALIVRQARAAGVGADFVGADALNTSEFVSIAGPAADGVRFSDMATPMNLPSASKVVTEFRHDGYEPEGYTLTSYAAIQAWAAGVTRSSTFDSAKVAAAMRTAPVDTVIGKISWDAKGDIEQMRYAWFIWQGGIYRQEPAE